MKVPNFGGGLRNWPMFIQMFKIFVHDAVSSDAERIAHLHDALTHKIRKNNGGDFLNPGLDHNVLHEMHKRYSNPQLVSQSCTATLLQHQQFKYHYFNDCGLLSLGCKAKYLKVFENAKRSTRLVIVGASFISHHCESIIKS